MRLVLATRHPEEHELRELDGLLAYGASPRASIGLVAAGRALALLRGRSTCCRRTSTTSRTTCSNHRLVLSFDAVADGVTVDDVLVATLTKVGAPRVQPSAR